MLRDERNWISLSFINRHKYKCLVQLVYYFFSSSKVDYKIKTLEKYKNVIKHQRNYPDIVRYERGRCKDPGETPNLKLYKNLADKQETKEVLTKISPSIINAKLIGMMIIRT